MNKGKIADRYLNCLPWNVGENVGIDVVIVVSNGAKQTYYHAIKIKHKIESATKLI